MGPIRNPLKSAGQGDRTLPDEPETGAIYCARGAAVALSFELPKVQRQTRWRLKIQAKTPDSHCVAHLRLRTRRKSHFVGPDCRYCSGSQLDIAPVYYYTCAVSAYRVVF